MIIREVANSIIRNIKLPNSLVINKSKHDFVNEYIVTWKISTLNSAPICYLSFYNNITITQNSTKKYKPNICIEYGPATIKLLEEYIIDIAIVGCEERIQNCTLDLQQLSTMKNSLVGQNNA